jgi:Domain of unknown function (DUF4864)
MTNYFNKTCKSLLFTWVLIILTSCPLNCYGRAFACAAMPFNTTNFLETVDNHILSLQEKNIAKAYYKYTSMAFQEQTSLKEFTSLIGRHAPLHDNETIQLSSIHFYEELGEYTGILTSTSGETMMIEYELTKSKDGWRIHGFKLMNYVCEQKGKLPQRGAVTASS